jgi:hypothetical protein
MATSHIISIIVMAVCLTLCDTSLAAQIATSDSSKNRYPHFENYPAIEQFRGQPASVDLSSHPNARTFRTRLREGAKKGPNFAGHYALVWWGCGNECQQALVVDLRTGIVYGLAGPSAKGPLESSRGLEFQPTSRLIIADPPCPKDYNPCVSSARTEEPARYYLMGEKGLKLIHKTPCKLETDPTRQPSWWQRCGD